MSVVPATAVHVRSVPITSRSVRGTLIAAAVAATLASCAARSDRPVPGDEGERRCALDTLDGLELEGDGPVALAADDRGALIAVANGSTIQISAVSLDGRLRSLGAISSDVGGPLVPLAIGRRGGGALVVASGRDERRPFVFMVSGPGDSTLLPLELRVDDLGARIDATVVASGSAPDVFLHRSGSAALFAGRVGQTSVELTALPETPSLTHPTVLPLGDDTLAVAVVTADGPRLGLEVLAITSDGVATVLGYRASAIVSRIEDVRLAWVDNELAAVWAEALSDGEFRLGVASRALSGPSRGERITWRRLSGAPTLVEVVAFDGDAQALATTERDPARLELRSAARPTAEPVIARIPGASPTTLAVAADDEVWVVWRSDAASPALRIGHLRCPIAPANP